jgi:hypothetical protein
MSIVDSRVLCCFEDHVVIQKNKQEHRYKYKKYLIPLEDDQPFQNNEEVVIISDYDFENLRKVIKKLRKDKKDLEEQLKKLKLEN